MISVGFHGKLTNLRVYRTFKWNERNKNDPDPFGWVSAC